MGNEKMNFAESMAFHGDYPPVINECEKFGMTWGCRPDCPVFERGECKIQEENEEFFLKEGMIDLEQND